MSTNLNSLVPVRTTEEWEHELGVAIQKLRLIRKLTQVELAGAANISLSAVQNLESGKGSTVKSLIAVARALGRSDWLNAITPPSPKISPMEMLRQKEAAPPPKRRYKKKTTEL